MSMNAGLASFNMLVWTLECNGDRWAVYLGYELAPSGPSPDFLQRKVSYDLV